MDSILFEASFQRVGTQIKFSRYVFADSQQGAIECVLREYDDIHSISVVALSNRNYILESK